MLLFHVTCLDYTNVLFNVEINAEQIQYINTFIQQQNAQYQITWSKILPNQC